MGHYKPVLPPKYPDVTETVSIIDIISFIKEEYVIDFKLPGNVVYVSPISDETSDETAIAVFSKDATLFPLTTHLMYGVSISLKGKTYHLSYDENNFLNVGFEGVLYLIENEDFVGDCLALYDIIWNVNGPDILSECISDDTEFTH